MKTDQYWPNKYISHGQLQSKERQLQISYDYFTGVAVGVVAGAYIASFVWYLLL